MGERRLNSVDVGTWPHLDRGLLAAAAEAIETHEAAGGGEIVDLTVHRFPAGDLLGRDGWGFTYRSLPRPDDPA